MLKTLVFVRLRSLVAGLRGKKKDGSVGGVGRLVLLSLAYLYIGGFLLFAFGGAAISFAPAMIASGLDSLYYAIFMLVAFSFIFLFSVFETKAHLFECRDNELLAAMPIKPSDIVLSRIFVVLIINYIEAALVFLPAVIAYAVFGGSPLGIIGGVLVYLLLPPLATSLSSGVGYLVALLARRFKNNSFIPLVLTVGFLALYFWGYSALLSMPEEEIENLENLIPVISNALAPISALGLSALLHPIATHVFVLVSVGASFIAYRAVSAGYTTVAVSSHTKDKKKYKNKPQRAGGAFSALARKEMRKFISSATYMLNGGLGALMYIVLAVAAVANRDSIISAIGIFSAELGMPIDSATLIPAVATAILVMLSATVTVSASALSLEGKSFALLKSMPVASRTVILAKLMPHILISSAASLIASATLVIFFGIEPLYAIGVIVTPILANVFAALVGIIMNILLPKLEFDNEVQPIKQSAAVGLTMLVTMVVGFSYFGATLFLSLFGLGAVMMLLGFAAFLVLSAALGIIAFIPIAKRLDGISG